MTHAKFHQIGELLAHSSEFVMRVSCTVKFHYEFSSIKQTNSFESNAI